MAGRRYVVLLGEDLGLGLREERQHAVRCADNPRPAWDTKT
jgi:hypothetical protein